MLSCAASKCIIGGSLSIRLLEKISEILSQLLLLRSWQILWFNLQGLCVFPLSNFLLGFPESKICYNYWLEIPIWSVAGYSFQYMSSLLIEKPCHLVNYCSDGAALVGQFICAYNCIQLLQQTQEVEVYIQVLQARQRRKEFVNSLVSIMFIYSACITCLS